jgi:predicted transcriptional regulator
MKISKQKKEKISEQILEVLFLKSPQPLFTSIIAREIARDEEFIKKILEELKEKNLIIKISKNPQGKPYLRRSRWKLSDTVYKHYKDKQSL